MVKGLLHQEVTVWISPRPRSSSSSSNEDTSTLPRMTVTTGQVRRQLERLHQRKASGPDGISTKILKTCDSQLSPVLQHLYNLSPGQERVLVLWQTSFLVPVPKKSTPSGLNDYRPVALTSYEGAGETGLGPPEAAGESPARPSAVCLPAPLSPGLLTI